MRTLVTATLAACVGLVGSVGVAAADPSTASENDVEVATSTPIQHLVVIFQENASFDHYFGTYPIAANPPGDPPFEARAGTPAVNNLLPTPLNGDRDLRASNPNLSVPFRLDRSQFVTCSQDHTYRAEQRAANLGLMDRFVQQTNKEGKACSDLLPRTVPSPQVMGYFDGNTVTALWNYAQHFALNDNAFATTYGPSTPGALNLVAGRTSGATPADDGGRPGDTVTQGVVYGDADPAHDACSDPAKTRVDMSGPNVGDLLSHAGISWGWFQGGFAWKDPAGDPEVQCETTHLNLNGIEESNYEAHHEPFQYFLSTANPNHLPPSSPAAIGHDDQANHQYGLESFWTAAEAGDMPSVSFLKAPGYQDGHPGPQNSNPLDEQDFLVETINRLQQQPQWSSTAVVLTWDDSDGWYDHEFPPNVHHSGNLALDTLYGVGNAANPDQLRCLMAPGKAPPDPATVFPVRCGYGERLPLLVVSPYAIENHVDHTLVDQSSVLRLIEDNWGLPRLGNASFDAEAGKLLNMFDFDQPPADALILNHFTGNPNRPPTVTDVRLTPSEPLTGDTLTVTSTVNDLDRDVTNDHGNRHDDVRLSYAWFDGDTRLPETGDTLELSVPGNGNRGDRITVQVTAYDGLDSTTESSPPVLVGDSAPAIELSASSAAVDYSDPLPPVRVTTADPDADPVIVDAVGLPAGLFVSANDDGSFDITGVADDAAGVYDARIRVSDGTLRTEAPLEVTVARERAHVAYTGDLLFGSPAGVRLQARVTQQDDGSPGDLTRAGVEFDLYSAATTEGTPNAVFHGRPNAEGQVTVVAGALATGTWTVVVRTEPERGFFDAPASDQVPVTVYVPRPGSEVTGAGSVHDPGYRDLPVPIDPANDHGILGAAATVSKRGVPAGLVLYAFQGADHREYLIRSTGWEGGGIAVSGRRAVLAGTCLVTVVDGSGTIVSRSGGYSFRLDVVDGTPTRDPDEAAVSVFTPGGDLYHRAGTPTAMLAVAHGQIVVHQ